jgi:hypothetical protein
MGTGRTAFSLAPLTKGVVIAGGFDLSSRPEVEMTSVEIIDDLIGASDGAISGIELDQPTIGTTPLPMPRAGCQGVSIPTNLLPPQFQGASNMPVIVLGGEYIDPSTGSCKVFDNATMLVNRDFSDKYDRSSRSDSSDSLAVSAGKAIIKVLKRRRQSSFDSGSTDMSSSSDSAMVWSDNVIPPMSRKRTAFAACVGTVWPKGHRTIPTQRFDDDMIDEGSMPIDHYQRRDASNRRSIWPDLLHEWLQGSVL